MATETGEDHGRQLRATDIKPGSMGRPLRGIDTTVLERDADRHVVYGAEALEAAGQFAAA